MPRESIVRIYRLGFALLVFVAVVAQFIYKQPTTLTLVINFFSYFTILSNLFAASVLLLLGFGAKTIFGVSVERLRLPAVVYMAVTGIVVLVLLEKYAGLGLTLPWVSDVLHRLMPVVLFADWLINPPKKKISLKAGFWLLLFPWIFVVYTLWRGPSVNWYPYPFLNPADVNGYFGVFMYVLGISAGTFVFSEVIILLGNELRKQGLSSR
jgi:hypothetical protein